MSSYDKIKNDPEAMAKRKAYHAQWQRDNKDKVKAYNTTYQAKKKRPEKFGAWISADERLPEQANDYLTVSEEGTRIRFYSKEWGWNRDYGDVFYWMPLPEPPKMKGE